MPGTPLAPAIPFEVGAGLTLLVGFKTRYVAVLLAGFAIISAVIFHADFGDQIQQTMFLKNVAMAGGLLLLAKVGAPSLARTRGSSTTSTSRNVTRTTGRCYKVEVPSLAGRWRHPRTFRSKAHDGPAMTIWCDGTGSGSVVATFRCWKAVGLSANDPGRAKTIFRPPRRNIVPQ